MIKALTLGALLFLQAAPQPQPPVPQPPQPQAQPEYQQIQVEEPYFSQLVAADANIKAAQIEKELRITQVILKHPDYKYNPQNGTFFIIKPPLQSPVIMPPPKAAEPKAPIKNPPK